MLANQAAVLAAVKEYYGKRLQHTKDLQTSACTCSKPPAHVIVALKQVPQRVKDRFYGCGNPVPQGIEGLSVLDLGSGSGRDCYVAALMVGARGTVTGIDMTDEQLAVARECQAEFEQQNPGKVGKMRFLSGYIEDIIGSGVAEKSMDLIISNCVVNLSPQQAGRSARCVPGPQSWRRIPFLGCVRRPSAAAVGPRARTSLRRVHRWGTVRWRLHLAGSARRIQ